MFRVCSYFLQSLKMRFSFKGLIYYCSLNCQIAIETLGVQVYKQELEGWRSSTVSWIDIYRFDRTSISDGIRFFVFLISDNHNWCTGSTDVSHAFLFFSFLCFSYFTLEYVLDKSSFIGKKMTGNNCVTEFYWVKLPQQWNLKKLQSKPCYWFRKKRLPAETECLNWQTELVSLHFSKVMIIQVSTLKFVTIKNFQL